MKDDPVLEVGQTTSLERHLVERCEALRGELETLKATHAVVVDNITAALAEVDRLAKKAGAAEVLANVVDEMLDGDLVDYPWCTKLGDAVRLYRGAVPAVTAPPAVGPLPPTTRT